MEIRLLFLTAFIASSGLPSVQPKIQTGIKTITDEVNADSKVQQNFRSLFDSLSKYDLSKTDSLRGSLEREAVKEKKAFDSMKEDFRLARENNAYRQRNLYKHGGNGEKAAVFKRETDGNTGTPGSESTSGGEKKTGAEDKADNLSGAKVDEKKDEEKKKNADRYKNSNERNDRREDDRQYKTYRSDRDNSPRYDRGGYNRGGSYDRREDRFSYDKREGAWSSNDRADDRYGGRREGGGSSYDRDDRPSYGRRDGPRPSYDRNERRDNWPPYGRRDDRRSFRDDDGRRPNRGDDDYGRRPNRGDDDYGRRPNRGDDDYGRRSNRRDDDDGRRSYHREGDDRKDNSRNGTQSKKADDDRRENGTSESSKDGGDDGKGGIVDKRHNRTDTGSANGTSETATEPVKCESDANDTRSEPSGGRDDKYARRRDDEPDRRGGRYDTREDDRNDRRGDNRYDRDGDRYDRRGDRHDRRDDDRYESRRGDRREDDRYGGRGDRDERRDDRDSRPSYRGRDRPSFGNRFEGGDEKPTFRKRFEKYDRPEDGDNDSKQRSEERQPRFGRRDDDRRDFRRDDFRRDDSRRDRPDRGETKRPWVARGSVVAHDLFVEALTESCSVLRGQLNYIELLREPINTMYGPNATQTNVTWTLAQPMKLINRTQKCIQEKNNDLVKMSVKDVTFDEMVTPMDQEYLDQLSGHWMALKNFLLDHVPAPEYREQYASVVDLVGKANDNLGLEYKVVKNVVKKLDKMKH